MFWNLIKCFLALTALKLMFESGPAWSLVAEIVVVAGIWSLVSRGP